MSEIDAWVDGPWPNPGRVCAVIREEDGAPLCSMPAERSMIVESVLHGLLDIMACDEHAQHVRAAAVVVAEIPFDGGNR